MYKYYLKMGRQRLKCEGRRGLESDTRRSDEGKRDIMTERVRGEERRWFDHVLLLRGNSPLPKLWTLFS